MATKRKPPTNPKVCPACKGRGFYTRIASGMDLCPICEKPGSFCSAKKLHSSKWIFVAVEREVVDCKHCQGEGVANGRRIA